jgi:S1-C subfamily serine protease
MEKNFKYYVAGILALVTVLLINNAGTDSDKTIYDKVAPKTYRMLNPDNLDSGGTGFSVETPSGRTFTLTNAHVCNMTNRGFIVAEQNGRMRRLAIIEISSEADLCLLEGVSGEEGLTVASQGVVPMGEKLFIVGHPYLQPTSLTNGFLNEKGLVGISYCQRLGGKSLANYRILPDDELPISLFDDCIKIRYSYFTDAGSAPGNSGSAVTNMDGEVVGVLFAGNGRGISLVVPLEAIHKFLAGY